MKLSVRKAVLAQMTAGPPRPAQAVSSGQVIKSRQVWVGESPAVKGRAICVIEVNGDRVIYGALTAAIGKKRANRRGENGMSVSSLITAYRLLQPGDSAHCGLPAGRLP